jgi:hypothetical protein
MALGGHVIVNGRAPGAIALQQSDINTDPVDCRDDTAASDSTTSQRRLQLGDGTEG